MQDFLVDMLVCPACWGALKWDIGHQQTQRIIKAEVACVNCNATYSVRDGIGMFLTPDLPRDDLWAQSDERLNTVLRDHPEIEDKLMNAPLESLEPADRFFRGMVLDERGHYAEAKTIMNAALPLIYTEDMLHCTDEQSRFVMAQIADVGRPIVDLACGRGYLVEMMLQADKTVVATDFSPSILRRNRKRFDALGLYAKLSLIAADARRMPFKDNSVAIMTTYLGLPNISQPGDVLKGLRRVVAGKFMAISQLYPDDDNLNTEVIRKQGLDALMLQGNAERTFAEAGWQIEVANAYRVHAEPTPTSTLLGSGIDGMPVEPIDILSCTLVAS